ncbi:MAG TPA: response regulator [Aggregatilineales bacterium]|nr:response regulator [Aggregatilineales bacterium]
MAENLRTMPVHILYIEDDPGIARLFEKRLEHLGYDVDLAFDGRTGLAMYDRGHYDVVTVDQKMPGYDGLQVIRLMSQRGPIPPTIMITGEGNEKVAAEAIKLGAGDYLVKDVDGGFLELVPAVIEQLLEKQWLLSERIRTLEALERQTNNLKQINHLGQALSADLNPDEVLYRLLSAAAQIAHAEASSVWLWLGEDRKRLRCHGTYSNGKFNSDVYMSLPVTRGLVGLVGGGKQGTFANGISSTDGSTPDGGELYADIDVYERMNVHSALAVPLLVRDNVIGVLEVANKTEGEFRLADLELLETLANTGSNAFDNAQLIERLRTQTEGLQERNEYLDAYAHMVAHDLRHPIGIIMGYSDLLQTEYLDALDETGRTYIERIVSGGHKLTSIIDELLFLAEVQRTDVKLRPLEMHGVIAQAEQRLSDVIAERGARITIPDVWPVVWGYGPWVEEIWYNYLSNALKYADQPPEIELGATPVANNMVKLWIRNKGQQLSSEQLKHLFGPSDRGAKQVERKRGHGWGLGIVRRIVEKLGGQVGVENDAGYGPVFSFTLPSIASKAATFATPV